MPHIPGSILARDDVIRLEPVGLGKRLDHLNDRHGLTATDIEHLPVGVIPIHRGHRPSDDIADEDEVPGLTPRCPYTD